MVIYFVALVISFFPSIFETSSSTGFIKSFSESSGDIPVKPRDNLSDSRDLGAGGESKAEPSRIRYSS